MLAIAAVVSLIVAVLNQLSLRSMHKQKLGADQALAELKIKADIELAERRFEFEQRLAERKVDLDRALAEKKIALDHELDIKKRRSAFAEEVLADFYEARENIRTARLPVTFDNEGSTRKKADWETEDDTRTINSYFATTERLTSKGEFFAQLFARRYRFLAFFGQQASQPYDEFLKVYREIIVAALMLVTTHRQRDQGSLPQNRAAWEAKAWDFQNEHDPINARIVHVIEAIERICRPVIQESVQ